MFNGDRASAIDYAEMQTVSVPPNHKQNEIEWASTPPGDPKVDFVVRAEKYLAGDKAFLQALNAQLAALRPRGSRNIFLFVHGFNTMFAEAVYRGVQLDEIRTRLACRCCSHGRRADRRRLTSKTSKARPPPATASNTRCVFCFQQRLKRSMCWPIPWAIG